MAKDKRDLRREAYDRAMAAQRRDKTCRDKTGEVGSFGDCLLCGADQGGVCKKP